VLWARLAASHLKTICPTTACWLTHPAHRGHTPTAAPSCLDNLMRLTAEASLMHTLNVPITCNRNIAPATTEGCSSIPIFLPAAVSLIYMFLARLMGRLFTLGDQASLSSKVSSLTSTQTENFRQLMIQLMLHGLIRSFFYRRAMMMRLCWQKLTVAIVFFAIPRLPSPLWKPIFCSMCRISRNTRRQRRLVTPWGRYAGSALSDICRMS